MPVIDEFQLLADDGEVVDVVVFQEMVSTRSRNNHHGVINGARSLETVDGRAVRRCNDMEFKIAGVWGWKKGGPTLSGFGMDRRSDE